VLEEMLATGTRSSLTTEVPLDGKPISGTLLALHKQDLTENHISQSLMCCM
jgi:hypothetical protein